jgi:Fe-S cluster assembly ATPase SufC
VVLQEDGVVSGAWLAVAPGEVFTFLGPNGAGKTTTIKVLHGHHLAVFFPQMLYPNRRTILHIALRFFLNFEL